MKKYEFLLFDFDGTLVDYDKTEAWNLAESFGALGLAYKKARHLPVYREINLRLWQEFERGEIRAQTLRVKRFRELFEVCGIQAAPEEISQVYIANQSRAAFLYDDALCVLKALRPRHKLGLITNGLKEIQRARLALTGADKYFDAVSVSDEIGVQKPEAGIFAHCFRAAGHTDKATALVIGDSLTSDIQGGVNFGIDTCWFNPSGKPAGPEIIPTYEIRRLSELPALLGVNPEEEKT
jgi:YjjG family noncanonical pyrimidine nucleotidase